MRLASAALVAATTTLLYTVPNGKRAIVTLNLANRATTVTKVRIALTGAAAPADADWIEYDADLVGAGVLLRTAIALGAAQRVYVQSSLVGVSASIWGLEEAVA